MLLSKLTVTEAENNRKTRGSKKYQNSSPMISLEMNNMNIYNIVLKKEKNTFFECGTMQTLN